MPNKFHRQNLRMGSNPFGRKSTLQKIAEAFGPKKKDKKVKKPTKRMMAKDGSKKKKKFPLFSKKLHEFQDFARLRYGFHMGFAVKSMPQVSEILKSK